MPKSLVIGLLMLGAFFTGLGFAQDETTSPKIQTIRGQIVALDTADLTMTVRWFRNDFDEINLKVPLGCQIRKGDQQITINELNIGDEVEVDYYDDGFTGLKAVKIFVTHEAQVHNFNY